MNAPEKCNIDPATVAIEVLWASGYDGLYNTECACSGRDLRPCGQPDDDIRDECKPGYLQPPESGYDFMVGPKPSQFVLDFQARIKALETELAAKHAENESLREFVTDPAAQSCEGGIDSIPPISCYNECPSCSARAALGGLL